MVDVKARGVRFNVTRLGQGEHVLVLVHGFIIDNSASYYLTLAPALQKDYSLVMYDLRGHGRSEVTPAGYAVQDGVTDLAAVLDAIGIDRPVTVIGNSGGGLLSLAFALRYPERLEGLILIDAHTGLPAFGEEIAQTVGAIGGSSPTKDAREMWDNWVARHNDNGELNRDGRELLESIQRFKKRQRSPFLERAQSLVQETSLIEDLRATPPISDQELASISCPVLAVYGAESELVPEAQRLAQWVPNCTVEVIDGCAHSVLVMKREALSAHMSSWLARVFG